MTLNITKEWTQNWTITQALWEIEQNWSDGIMEKHRVTPSSLVIKETRHGDCEIIAWDAYHISTVPEKRIQENSLGYIQYFAEKAIIQFVNLDIQLKRKILRIGESSKRSTGPGMEHIIGGHGEGFKIGV